MIKGVYYDTITETAEGDDGRMAEGSDSYLSADWIVLEDTILTGTPMNDHLRCN
jgi:hypothetical protein